MHSFTCISEHLWNKQLQCQMHFSCSGNPKQFGQTLITRESLELGPELGQGEFGSVLKGIWTDPKGDKVSLECLSHDKNIL